MSTFKLSSAGFLMVSGVIVDWKGCISSVQFSSVQFSSVQFSSVQFSSVQFSSVQFSSVQFSSVQFSSVHILKFLYIQYLDKNTNQHWCTRTLAENFKSMHNLSERTFKNAWTM